MTRVCVRCTKEFQLNMKGKIVRDSCVYHLKSKSRIPGSKVKVEYRHTIFQKLEILNPVIPVVVEMTLWRDAKLELPMFVTLLENQNC